ncbi:HEXXH motif-containing putative peptide modification protein [Pendulispora brunnea]|uniref:HEXXH motif-containing putative peptide modification protein n=1 Tax=Pendulispora brunnea TaxID=2905690 RepID=A0ABZ2JZU6_9BACT
MSTHVTESMIRAADRALAQHPEFGDSSAISTLVTERYKFGLDLFAPALPGVARALPILETWEESTTNALFADPLIQFSIERAFESLANGEPATSPHELERWLGVATASFARGGRLGLVQDQMNRPWPVAKGKTYLWDLPAANPVTSELERNFREHFMTGRDVQVEFVAPDERTAGAVDRACSLFGELLPETADSVFRHVSAMALAVMRAGGGRLLTGSAGDGVPGTVILSSEEIDNPWDTAAHLLHEGLHEKFADITRFASLIRDNVPVGFPWRADEEGFTLARALSAFHVYVHFVLYESAVRCYGARLTGRYGSLDAHPVSAHAMSVVRTGSGPYARGAERCRYLGKQLSTTWAAHLTSAGQRFVHWLLECIEPIGVTESPPVRLTGEAPPIVRVSRAVGYRKNPHLKERPLENEGLLFAFAPEMPRVQLLTLNSWIISELCDGSTMEAIGERYFDIVGARLTPAEAQQQLALGLQQLERGRVIEKVP